VLFAGEETNESLSTRPRAAAAAQQSSGSERVARERERGGKRDAADGRGMQVYASTAGEKKNARASCGPFFSVSLKISVFFFFLSLLIFYSC